MLTQENTDMLPSNNLPTLNQGSMFRSNSLRQIKTDGDLNSDSYDMNNSTNFYRSNGNQFRNGGSRIQTNNLTFNNNNYNNGKRFTGNNSFSYMPINNSIATASGSSYSNALSNFIESDQIGLNTNLVSLSEYNINDQLNNINETKALNKQSDFDDSTSNESNSIINGNDEESLYEAEWSILQEPRFKFLKDDDRTMFDLIFRERKNFKKIADIFGTKHNYLEEVRAELAGTNEDPEANTFILVNCLLNRSFSKIRLNRFFNALNQITNDRSMNTYVYADVERRQRLIDSIHDSEVAPSSSDSGSCLNKCLDMFTEYNIMPSASALQ